ncbi:MAG: phosphoadenosine phosphosulfate reductase family protein [Gammaproteobacteria bacterium]|nr:phosphoadenosine phosphosulfate reductase family protein [Gammaproteobacteria bacterium]
MIALLRRRNLPNEKIKHVLGISGGKDSAALAVYMNLMHPELDVEYFFTDTGKELPEVYSYLTNLEGFLGKNITRLDPSRDFDFWLNQYNNFLPSAQTRWCTRMLKLKPFEEWVKKDFLDNGYTVYSYVAIRADEEFREGYASKSDKLIVKLPFKEDGVDKAGVMDLLDSAGLGLPAYYSWRSRSGCTFCFFQRKIEWVSLMVEHPEAFEEAKAYEKTALEHGSPFSWSQGETLIELSQPERVAEIKADYEKRLAREKAKRVQNPLRPNQDPIDIDDLYGQQKMCVTCHK